MKKTNKFLSLLALALVMVGCTDDLAPDTMMVDNEIIKLSDQEIKFDVASNPAATRSGYGDYELLQIDVETDGFGVFASYTGTEHYVNTTVWPNYMYNQKVNKTGSEWFYTPAKYWPATDSYAGGISDEKYVSFFAYAPYTETPNYEHPERTNCIASFSDAHELGDPSLIYVLSPDPWDLITSAETGNPDDDDDGQVDLLYGQFYDGTDYVAMVDCQKPAIADAGKNTKFSFRHALGVVGNTIRIALKDDAAKTAFMGKKVLVKKVVVNYTNLTRKAQLVLNSNGSPNWKPVISGEVTTSRSVTIEGTQIPSEIRAADTKVEALAAYSDAAVTGIVTAASDDAYYDLETERPLFYIPYQVGEQPQQAEVTLTYQVIGADMEPYDGVAKSVVALTTDANEVNNLNLLISDKLEYEDLKYPKIGDPYFSDGTWGANPHAYGAVPIGIVGYLGDDIPDAEHGLIISLRDARMPNYDPTIMDIPDWVSDLQIFKLLTDNPLILHTFTYHDISYVNEPGKGMTNRNAFIAWYNNYANDEDRDYLLRATYFSNGGIYDGSAFGTYAEAYDDVEGQKHSKAMLKKWYEMGGSYSYPRQDAAFLCSQYEDEGVGAKGNWYMGSFGEWARILDACAAKSGVTGTTIQADATANNIQAVTTYDPLNANFATGRYYITATGINNRLLMPADGAAYPQSGISNWIQLAATQYAPEKHAMKYDLMGTECTYWTSTQASDYYSYSIRLQYEQQCVHFFGKDDPRAQVEKIWEYRESCRVRPLLKF